MKFWFPNKTQNLILVDNKEIKTYPYEEWDNFDSSQNPISVTRGKMPDEWVQRVNSIKERIQSGEIKKEIAHWDFKFKGGSPVGWLMNQEGNGRFLVQVEEGKMLYGNSPELILDKHGDSIKLEILGGTDQWNEKTGEEHSIIIEEFLKSFPNKVNIQQTELVDFGYIKHLRTKLSSTWTHSLNLLIPHIWPNLAIRGKGCGENYWGGLIGWGNELTAQLWLCIRCGIWDGEWHHIRVGCGITEKSSPIEEWEELQKKLGWLLT